MMTPSVRTDAGIPQLGWQAGGRGSGDRSGWLATWPFSPRFSVLNWLAMSPMAHGYLAYAEKCNRHFERDEFNEDSVSTCFREKNCLAP
jgi:hypothetical protein